MQKISTTEAETLSSWRFYNLKLPVLEKTGLGLFELLLLPARKLKSKGFKAMLIECFKDNFDMKLSISTSEKNPTKGPTAVKIHVHLGKQRAQSFSLKWKALGHSLTIHTLKRCWQPSSRSL